MNTLGSAVPLVEAPTTATVFGANNGPNCSNMSWLICARSTVWVVIGRCERKVDWSIQHSPFTIHHSRLCEYEADIHRNRPDFGNDQWVDIRLLDIVSVIHQ